MSLFRSRKKSFNDVEGLSRPSFDESAPPVPSGGLGKYSFRRKKVQPDVKKEFDLATALPSSNDFRTSLLMPNLSARFSMLREQDDPTTKVGKASDDSVLFPKRASRLNLFTNADLADIAEVTSISGSIRPPFANERSSTYSAGDGYATDDDKHVMSRSRPGQGNKFFGGRQKVYMLTGKDSATGRSKGRAVYDDDININAYNMAMQRKLSAEDNDPESDTDYNSKRETSSSTNSGPSDSRSSTAATSVASNAPSPANPSSAFANKLTSFSTAGADRPAKGKRMYGQGLDQHIHDQQSSAYNRLNNIQRNFGPGMVHYGSIQAPVTRSTSNPQTSPSISPPVLPPILPAISQSSAINLNGFNFGSLEEDTKESIAVSQPAAFSNSTVSPSIGPVDPTLIAALDANDLGKATATGAFNKPAGPYNDEQFAQRQLQLQQERDTPSPTLISRTGTHKTHDTGNTRERNGSLASQRSAFSFQSSNNPSQPSIRGQSSLSHIHSHDLSEQDEVPNETGLAELSESEYDSEPASPRRETTKTLMEAAFTGAAVDPVLRHRKYEHDDQHPAFNSHLQPGEQSPNSMTAMDLPIQSHETSLAPSIYTPEHQADENEVKGGLSDLVRGHLRNISNQSSVYPDSPTQSVHGNIPDFPPELARQHIPSPVTETPQNLLAARARAMLDNANQIRHAASSREPEQTSGKTSYNEHVIGDSGVQINGPIQVPWSESLKNHQRQGSTETQREREDFANELADRRKQVQSNLRNYVSDNQTSNEQNPSRSGPLGLLKKASLSNLAGRGDGQSRNAKIIGALENQQNSPIQDVSRNAFQNTKSSEHLNRMGSGPASAQSLRERNFNNDQYSKSGRNGFDPSTRGMERAAATKTPSPNPNGYGFMRTSPEANQVAYHPAGRSRKYSPPNASRSAEPGAATYKRSGSAQSQTPPAYRSPALNGSYFPPGSPSSPSSTFNDQNRGFAGVSQQTSFNAVPPPNPPYANVSIHRNGSAPNLNISTSRKGSVNKSEISTPTLVSGTYSMDTVDVLPYGSSLSNSTDPYAIDAPPLPPINPRRRGQNFFMAFGGRSANNAASSSNPTSNVTTPTDRTPYFVDEPEEMSPRHAEAAENRPRVRNRLRKSSSAGENMSHRARHQALKDLERLPRSPDLSTASKGMF